MEIYPVLCSDTNGLDLSLAAEALKTHKLLRQLAFLARGGGGRGGLVQSVRLPCQRRKK